MSDSPADPKSVEAIFAALGDPTRRRLVEALAAARERTATQLAAEFPMTRQAIAKHLQVLAAAGLATASRDGRETRWSLVPDPLGGAVEWLAVVATEADAAGGSPGTAEGLRPRTEDDGRVPAELAERMAALQRHLADRQRERGIDRGSAAARRRRGPRL